MCALTLFGAGLVLLTLQGGPLLRLIPRGLGPPACPLSHLSLDALSDNEHRTAEPLGCEGEYKGIACGHLSDGKFLLGEVLETPREAG